GREARREDGGIHRRRRLEDHVPGCAVPDHSRAPPDLDRHHAERAVQLRRNVAADRGRRGAGHDSTDEPASSPTEVRRLHEKGPRQVPGTAGGTGRVLIWSVPGAWCPVPEIWKGPAVAGPFFKKTQSPCSLAPGSGRRVSDMIIVLFGKPGAGKGTQAPLL